MRIGGDEWYELKCVGVGEGVEVRVRVGWGTSVLRASGSKKSLDVCFNFS